MAQILPLKRGSPSTFVSFFILVGICFVCIGSAYLVEFVIKPAWLRQRVYFHHTNTPSEICGDNFYPESDPDGDVYSYWHDLNYSYHIKTICQAQQTIIQLNKPPIPYPEDDIVLTSTSYHGDNNGLPTPAEVQLMGYRGVFAQSSFVFLPESDPTQAGILFHRGCEPCDTNPLFFSIDGTGHWKITTLVSSEYFNESEYVGQTVQTITMGQILPQSRYLLRIEADIRNKTLTFSIDHHEVATLPTPAYAQYNIELLSACPDESTSLCPIGLTDFTFDVVH